MAEWHNARPYLLVFFFTSGGRGFSVNLMYFVFRKLKVMIITYVYMCLCVCVCVFVCVSSQNEQNSEHGKSRDFFPIDILHIQKNSLLLVGNKYLFFIYFLINIY